MRWETAVSLVLFVVGFIMACLSLKYFVVPTFAGLILQGRASKKEVAEIAAMERRK